MKTTLPDPPSEIYIDERDHPRYDEALKEAASHFLSRVPSELSGDEIMESLESYANGDSEHLHPNIILWESLRSGNTKSNAETAAIAIEGLACSFIRFLNS